MNSKNKWEISCTNNVTKCETKRNGKTHKRIRRRNNEKIRKQDKKKDCISCKWSDARFRSRCAYNANKRVRARSKREIDFYVSQSSNKANSTCLTANSPVTMAVRSVHLAWFYLVSRWTNGTRSLWSVSFLARCTKFTPICFCFLSTTYKQVGQIGSRAYGRDKTVAI